MTFRFDKALTRQPGQSVVHGLTTQEGPPPMFGEVAYEHAAYVEALRQCALSVEVLPSLEEFPDSIFVEDPALVFGASAVLLRPGAPSRLGEVTDLEQVLTRRFARTLQLTEGFADGGDILHTPQGVMIGLSKRTDAAGAAALGRLLSELEIPSRIVQTPADTLHLKSDCSLIDTDCILCTAGLAASGLFSDFRTLIVPDAEKRAANSLRVNDTVLVGEAFPQTIELLHNNGYQVNPVSIAAIGKLDAGLSCMSLRWQSPDA